MGFIADLFGFGSKGSDFQAQGVGQAELLNAAGRINNARQQQQQFISALANQNPLAQQSNLAQQLLAQSQGAGPNPALAQLANTTGQNIQNQAALMAGAKGVSQNPGLTARNIGQMGAQQQQQAAGQAAALRAQQQLEAQNQLGNIYGQQLGAQQRGVQDLSGMDLANQQQMLSMLSSQNAANAGVAAGNVKRGGDIFGGLLGGIGSALGFAEGGVVPQVGTSSLARFAAMSKGGHVPGKATVKGDSEKNDTVPALLSPGEVVIPRSKVKDPHKVAAFINQVLGMNLSAKKKA